MHDALLIPEILDQILTHLLSLQPGRRGQNDVISVSLTSRALVQVALDVAWKEQTSLVPLIKTLPQRCWEDVYVPAPTLGMGSDEMMRRFNRSFTFLVDELTEEEEERFTFYARRIRRLEYLPFAYHIIPTKGELPSDLQIIRTIWSIRKNKDQPLLPNLQHLIFATPQHASAALEVFLETKGVSLGLCWYGRVDSVLNALFSVIERYAINMQELDLGDYVEVSRPEEDAGLSKLVCGMKDLRALSCGAHLLSGDAIRALASLPHLRRLCVVNSSLDILNGLQLRQTQTGGHSSTSTSGPPFPELKELVLRETAQSHSSFASLMKRLRPVHIQKLTIQILHVPPTSEINDTFLALSQGSSNPTTIHSIEYKFIHNPHPPSSTNLVLYNMEGCQTLINGRTLAPLLSLPNLTTLDLDVFCKFDLGDREVREMADAWRGLRKLRLGSMVGWNHPSRITYDGLLDLLLKCPELEYLAICFDAASHVPINTSLSSPSLPSSAISPAHVNRNIKYLYIGDSTIGSNNPDAIGRFLAEVLPRCEGISGRWLMHTEAVGSFYEWYRVLAALKKYRGVNVDTRWGDGDGEGEGGGGGEGEGEGEEVGEGGGV